jgi:hypothetical protein
MICWVFLGYACCWYGEDFQELLIVGLPSYWVPERVTCGYFGPVFAGSSDMQVTNTSSASDSVDPHQLNNPQEYVDIGLFSWCKCFLLVFLVVGRIVVSSSYSPTKPPPILCSLLLCFGKSF